jgi:hypothetical protein
MQQNDPKRLERDAQVALTEMRGQLLERVRSIDPSLMVEISLGSEVRGSHFSDWHDRFNDGGRFTDGFGKAGDRPAERGLFGRIRIFLARILGVRISQR